MALGGLLVTGTYTAHSALGMLHCPDDWHVIVFEPISTPLSQDKRHVFPNLKSKKDISLSKNNSLILKFMYRKSQVLIKELLTPQVGFAFVLLFSVPLGI